LAPIRARLRLDIEQISGCFNRLCGYTGSVSTGIFIMRTAGLIVSILLILMGGLWALQGVGLVGGSFMTGNSNWTVIGVVTAVVGLVGLFFSRRRS